MKSTEEYFAPTPSGSIQHPTNIQHGQEQRRRTILPVVAFGAVMTLMFVIVFSLGFYVGTVFDESNPGKESGQVFDKPLTQPLNENLPGYVEPKAPALIRKAEG